MLAQLPEGFTTLVTGAGGGIGRAVVETLLASPRPGRVIAASRRPMPQADPRLEPLEADLTTPEGRERLAAHLDGTPLHLTFNTLGMLHDEALGIHPEKKLDDLDAEAMAHLFHVNATTPAAAPGAAAQPEGRAPGPGGQSLGPGRLHRGQSSGRLVRLSRQQGSP
ncbi:hypothetical protein [Halomonas sp. JS92-SW72]|uniref:hypothetical protein n=1 Tax=Halomonas sp. JS92-SW72 TaxID=2306583 RepID=UPI003204950D